MKVSLLNEKIIFQKSVVAADAIGNRKNVWKDYYSCFATIGGEGGNEKTEEVRQQMKQLSHLQSDIAVNLWTRCPPNCVSCFVGRLTTFFL